MNSFLTGMYKNGSSRLTSSRQPPDGFAPLDASPSTLLSDLAPLNFVIDRTGSRPVIKRKCSTAPTLTDCTVKTDVSSESVRSVGLIEADHVLGVGSAASWEQQRTVGSDDVILVEVVEGSRSKSYLGSRPASKRKSSSPGLVSLSASCSSKVRVYYGLIWSLIFNMSNLLI